MNEWLYCIKTCSPFWHESSGQLPSTQISYWYHSWSAFRVELGFVDWYGNLVTLYDTVLIGDFSVGSRPLTHLWAFGVLFLSKLGIIYMRMQKLYEIKSLLFCFLVLLRTLLFKLSLSDSVFSCFFFPPQISLKPFCK